MKLSKNMDSRAAAKNDNSAQ